MPAPVLHELVHEQAALVPLERRHRLPEPRVNLGPHVEHEGVPVVERRKFHGHFEETRAVPLPDNPVEVPDVAEVLLLLGNDLVEVVVCPSLQVGYAEREQSQEPIPLVPLLLSMPRR